MADGIYTALAGSIVQDRNLEVLSHNLANVNTPGFKAERVAFEEVLTNEVEKNPDLRSVRLTNSGLDTRPGALVLTENPFDAALEGDGFFSVQTPRGVMYTRRGVFDVNVNGELVTQEGQRVLGESGGPIKIPEGSSLWIEEDGTAWSDLEMLDRLKIVRSVARCTRVEAPCRTTTRSSCKATSRTRMSTRPRVW